MKIFLIVLFLIWCVVGFGGIVFYDTPRAWDANGGADISWWTYESTRFAVVWVAVSAVLIWGWWIN